MKAVLSSNIPNRYHAALALQKVGYLQKYICAVGVSRRSAWLYRVLPGHWDKKLRGRDISGVDPERVKSIWMPELLQKALPRAGLISKDRGNWINNHLYDMRASQYVEDCDIFHFTSSVGLYSARKAKKRGAVLLCDQRAAYPDSERELVREECEKLGIRSSEPSGILYDEKVKAEYAMADYFVIGSEFAKRTFVEAGYDPDRIFVVPYGVDVQPDGSSMPDDGGVFRIVYAGQIVPRKGVHYLVQAFEELGLPDAELLLVGSVGEEMRLLVERWAENSRITASGSVPRLQLNDYYGRSSVFVLPSVSDSFGLVVSEAMAAGPPVIVTENTGGGELMREGVDGFTIPIRDLEALKERILRLYENPGLRWEMGTAAQDRVKEFSWEKYGERLIWIYEEIARREGIAK